ncbi:MAG: hypothetical protein WD535_00755 [Thermaerobacterales bacterium]
MNTELLALEQLGERDVRFVVASVVSEPAQYERVERLARAEPQALEAMLDDPRLLRRIINDGEILLKISPYLLFTVLLRQVRRDLGRTGFTIEWSAPRERVPVFDAAALAMVLDDIEIRHYLADMLASFTRIESASARLKDPERFEDWRFSELDLEAMIRMGVLIPHAERLAIFRRVGDVSLLLTGVFPDHAGRQSLTRRPERVIRGADSSRGETAGQAGFASCGPAGQIEELGRRYYRMAARHPNASWLGWETVLNRLAEEFAASRRVLNVLSDLYIHRLRFDWFPTTPGELGEGLEGTGR